jgi:uncharacterized damage-inducible protein DinB
VSGSTLFTTLFKYKAWANNEILTSIKLFAGEAQAALRHTAIGTMNHTYVVDRILPPICSDSSMNMPQPTQLIPRRWSNCTQPLRRATSDTLITYRSCTGRT